MAKNSLQNYGVLLAEVKARVRSSQYEALKAVNKELIGLYWDIGRIIEEKQKGKTWGKSIVERLARDLRSEFPGIQGFSAQNLWRMRQFYAAYAENAKLSPLVREIGWTHNVNILTGCKDELEREFYIRMTRKYGWTKNVLAMNIEAQTWRQYLLNQTNFDKTVPDKARNQTRLAVKDEYTFDFLGLGEEHSEKELESALIARVNRFLTEMGGVFTFAGSQFRLEVEGQEYFIDILLYHRHLKCLVAIELKAGEFMPEHVGKMQFYLAALDALVKTPDENPSIGIVICRSKKRMIVEYSLRESKKPIGVSTYKVFRTVPAGLKGQLPSPKQVSRLLAEGFGGGSQAKEKIAKYAPRWRLSRAVIVKQLVS